MRAAQHWRDEARKSARRTIQRAPAGGKLHFGRHGWFKGTNVVPCVHTPRNARERARRRCM
eukprot:gene17726-biopygen8350